MLRVRYMLENVGDEFVSSVRSIGEDLEVQLMGKT